MNELSETIQEDICACCDGILENEVPPAVLDKLKTALCQIVVDNTNLARLTLTER